MNNSSIAREYRIAPMYLRCCWYTMSGMILIAATAIVLDHFLVLPRKAGLYAYCSFLSAVAFCMATPLFWKLQVNGTGIHRHRIIGTDFWSWSNFASGKLEKQFRYTIKDVTRPFWRRKISFNFLDSNEREELWSRINSYYRLPPPPAVPEQLEIKYGWRRTIRLDRNVIHVVAGNNIRESLWNEVQYVVIVMFDLKRRDFHNLELAVANETIELKVVSQHGSPAPSWRGADAEIISEFLKAHVPSDKLRIVTSISEVLNQDYLVKQHFVAKKQVRELRTVALVFSPLLLGCAIWMAIDDGIWKGIYFGVLYSVLFVPVFMMLDRSKLTKVREITERIAKLEAG